MKNNHIKNLYLHVGMSKTATSSIQDTLYANRELLEQNNYFYSKKLPKNHSDTFRMLCWDSPENQHTSIKLGLDAEKIKLINKQNIDIIYQEISETSCSNVIFSGESISNFTPHELDKCKTFLNNLAPAAKIHIVISTRNPIDFLNSLVQQRKRTSSGGREKNFDLLYESKFKKLFTVFDKSSVIAYKFEDACQHKFGPVGHFLHVIGISNDSISNTNIISSNSSISDKAIDIIDFVNQAVPMLDGNRISEGRIHLDYSNFYKLTGNKFQIGKDCVDINFSIENLSKSCQWLKENMGIEYRLKDLPDSSPKIVYDPVFSDEIKNIYTYLTPVLKKLTYDYINDRRQDPNIDSLSNKTLNQLLEWIASNHKHTLDHELANTIKSQCASIANDEKQRDQLLKRFKSERAETEHFFRDVALFLEHYEMNDEALFFIDKAKMYSPTIESVNQTLKKNKTIVASDKKHHGQLLKRFKRDDIRAGQFFRDVALFLEHYEMLKASLFFMGKAKMYSPNLKSVDEKLKKYETILENKREASSHGEINKMTNIFKNFRKVFVNKCFQRFISEDAVYRKSLDNEKILNKILSSDKAVDKILSGNKTLDKILAGDRTLHRILNNEEILNKILSDRRCPAPKSNSNALNKTSKNEKRLPEQQQLLSEDKVKSLGYSLPSYLVGFPRSGTNFLQSVLEGSSGLLCRSLYGPPKVNQNNILSLKSHTPSYEFLLDEIGRFVPEFGTPDKFILIIRDPRDVFISFYEFVQSTKGLSITQSEFIYEVCYFFATFEDRHKVNSRKLEFAPLSIFDAYKKHIDSWFVNRPPSMDCHVVKYEDLVLSPESEFQRIFDFLNLDCSLEKEKLKLKVSQYSTTSRKRGVIGGWRDCQDEYDELISSVNNSLKKEITILGYPEE